MKETEQFTKEQVRLAQQFSYMTNISGEMFTRYGEKENVYLAELNDNEEFIYHEFDTKAFFYGFNVAKMARFKDLAFDESIAPSEVDFTDPTHPVLLHDLTEPVVKLRVRNINEVGREIAYDILEQSREKFNRAA